MKIVVLVIHLRQRSWSYHTFKPREKNCLWCKELSIYWTKLTQHINKSNPKPRFILCLCVSNTCSVLKCKNVICLMYICLGPCGWKGKKLKKVVKGKSPMFKSRGCVVGSQDSCMEVLILCKVNPPCIGIVFNLYYVKDVI
jgi:hypothetical protein